MPGGDEAGPRSPDDVVVRALRAGPALPPDGDPAAIGAYQAMLSGITARFVAHRDAPAVLARFLRPPPGPDRALRHFLAVSGAGADPQVRFEAQRLLMLLGSAGD